MIDIKIEHLKDLTERPDIWVVPLFYGEEAGPRTLGIIGKELARKLKGYAKEGEAGSLNRLRLILDEVKINGMAFKGIVLSLGDPRKASDLYIRESFGTLYRYTEGLGVKSASIFCPKGAKIEKFLEPAAEGLALSSYSFDKYRSLAQKEFGSYSIVFEEGRTMKGFVPLFSSTRDYLDAVKKIRDNANEPPNILDPSGLRQRFEEVGHMKGVNFKVIEAKTIKALGMNALHAVGRGSETGSMLLILEYLPKGCKRKVALLGKGITFDSGGYSIKGARQMLNMKGDMLGATIVLAAVELAARKGSDVGIVGLVPCAENLISDRAMKPDEVVRTLSGKTVEIESTDAEGRLILADTLSYSSKYSPDEIMDIATISGAAQLALGDLAAMYVSNSEKLSGMFERASRESGETFVRIPLLKEYLRYLKSSVADLKNVTIGSGGSLLTSAVFLSEFTQDAPWLHVDLAGVDFTQGEVSPIFPKGSTGFGVKTILKYLDLI